MTEDLILSEESVASEEQAVRAEPVTAKKAYVTPQMEIEYFEVEDIITSSVETLNQTRANGVGVEGNEPDDPFDW